MRRRLIKKIPDRGLPSIAVPVRTSYRLCKGHSQWLSMMKTFREMPRLDAMRLLLEAPLPHSRSFDSRCNASRTWPPPFASITSPQLPSTAHAPHTCGTSTSEESTSIPQHSCQCFHPSRRKPCCPATETYASSRRVSPLPPHHPRSTLQSMALLPTSRTNGTAGFNSVAQRSSAAWADGQPGSGFIAGLRCRRREGSRLHWRCRGFSPVREQGRVDSRLCAALLDSACMGSSISECTASEPRALGDRADAALGRLAGSHRSYRRCSVLSTHCNGTYLQGSFFVSGGMLPRLLRTEASLRGEPLTLCTGGATCMRPGPRRRSKGG